MFQLKKPIIVDSYAEPALNKQHLHQGSDIKNDRLSVLYK